MSGRIRTIKPELLEDEVASALSNSAWRTWVSMWLLADDYGNLRAASNYLASHVFQDTNRMPEIDSALAELTSAGLVKLYIVNEQRYANITGFVKHQRIDNAGKPRVPFMPDQEFSVTSGDNLERLPRTSASFENQVEFAAVPSTSDLVPTTSSGTKTARRTRVVRALTELPDSWVPSDANYAIGANIGLDKAKVDFEAEKFRDYNRSKGGKYKDWTAAFNNWLRNAPGYSVGTKTYQGSKNVTLPQLRQATPLFDKPVVVDAEYQKLLDETEL